ncbi:response regulator transcription factor [Sphingomonas faeni]|uniref:response regulator transcription factor n=1 Tax=Sphingomonas faeni TaxID=185950 RepID=UPI0020C0BE42|nr:response regulator [Sphingomonas faeni]
MIADRPIYVIDDEPEMCRSLALLLSTDGSPARSFSSADVFLDMLDRLSAGIIISDVMMPGTDGIELLACLAARERDDPVIIIAGHADVPLAVKALQAGALDLLEKPFEAKALFAAIAAARRRTTDLDAARATLIGLSRREREVLSFIIDGATTKEIALKLTISPRTVETYRAHLMEKTGADSIPMLVRLGMHAGLG